MVNSFEVVGLLSHMQLRKRKCIGTGSSTVSQGKPSKIQPIIKLWKKQIVNIYYLLKNQTEFKKKNVIFQA